MEHINCHSFSAFITTYRVLTFPLRASTITCNNTTTPYNNNDDTDDDFDGDNLVALPCQDKKNV